MKLFSKEIAVLAFSILALNATLEANNSCPRCRLIEAERAAQGPQNVGYYDDAFPVHESGTTGAQNNDNAAKPAENTPTKTHE